MMCHHMGRPEYTYELVTQIDQDIYRHTSFQIGINERRLIIYLKQLNAIKIICLKRNLAES